jgi:hypothetical protein
MADVPAGFETFSLPAVAAPFERDNAALRSTQHNNAAVASALSPLPWTFVEVVRDRTMPRSGEGVANSLRGRQARLGRYWW